MLFFRNQGPGDGLPFLDEYLLCADFHWSWRQLQEMPNNVLAYWRVYREMRIKAEMAERAAQKG